MKQMEYKTILRQASKKLRRVRFDCIDQVSLTIQLRCYQPNCIRSDLFICVITWLHNRSIWGKNGLHYLRATSALVGCLCICLYLLVCEQWACEEQTTQEKLCEQMLASTHRDRWRRLLTCLQLHNRTWWHPELRQVSEVPPQVSLSAIRSSSVRLDRVV